LSDSTQFLLQQAKNTTFLVGPAKHADCKQGSMPVDASFRNLKVWQRSMTLVEEIYGVTRSFPRHEQFGLTAQIRRASVSIPSNIAEGKRRKRQLVYLNHLDIALGYLPPTA